jgi:hypothetical protein
MLNWANDRGWADPEKLNEKAFSYQPEEVWHGPEGENSGALLEACDAATQNRKSSETGRVGVGTTNGQITERSQWPWSNPGRGRTERRPFRARIRLVGRATRTWVSRPRLYSGAPRGAQPQPLRPRGSRPRLYSGAPRGAQSQPSSTVGYLSRTRDPWSSGVVNRFGLVPKTNPTFGRNTLIRLGLRQS